MSGDVLLVEDLHKSYGDLQVLRGVNLRVAPGQAYGLLGPNGTGKSTLIHLLLGFLKPSKGQVHVLNSTNLEQVRIRIGYVPERQRYHTRYSAREYLRFIGQFSGLSRFTLVERVERELATVGLSEAADRQIGTFSKGMLQRLGIAQALLSSPDLLLIDEPTSGLDPAGQRSVIDLLTTVRERGHTIFLCTHYLQEVERLCDRVGVLARGRIVVEHDVAAVSSAGTNVRIDVSPLSLDMRRELERIEPAVRCDSTMILLNPNSPQLQARVLRHLLDNDVAILRIEALESPLERLYIQAIQGEAPEQAAAPLWARPPSATPESAIREEHGDQPSGTGDTLLNQLLGKNAPTQPEAHEPDTSL